ncbi:MAG TPA: GerMN domain-containing protein [Firmicutes bacterium]|nr:GerMN domain-containing protein [Bacillota bacterium]
MKKKGVVTGILFVVLLAFVFQAEIGGFFASVRSKAHDAVNADTAALMENENLPALSDSEADDSESTTEEEGTASAPPVPEGMTADSESTDQEEDGSAEETSAPVTYKEVSLYFVNDAENEMAVEKRSIVNQVGVAKTTMQELLSGPVDTSLASYIPDGTQVLGINIGEDGICTVDFSEDIQKAELNSTEERYVIESIVETLSQFDSVSAVQIRVNGEVVQSLTGHWDISHPISSEDL